MNLKKIFVLVFLFTKYITTIYKDHKFVNKREIISFVNGVILNTVIFVDFTRAIVIFLKTNF